MICVQTWEDWRQPDVFHLLYDWLLVLLQERLLSSQGTYADSMTTAWFQMLWVATITVLLLIISAAKLVWNALRVLFTSGELTYKLYMATRGVLLAFIPCNVVNALITMQLLRCKPDQPGGRCQEYIMVAKCIVPAPLV